MRSRNVLIAALTVSQVVIAQPSYNATNAEKRPEIASQVAASSTFAAADCNTQSTQASQTTTSSYRAELSASLSESRQYGVSLSDIVPEAPGPIIVASAALHIPSVDNIIPLELVPGHNSTSEEELFPSNRGVTQAAATGGVIQPSPTTTSPPSETHPAEPAIVFVTITNAPVTRTILDITTLTRTFTIPAPPPPPPPPKIPDPPAPYGSSKHAWSSPADFENLDCFGILKYGFGQSNLKVVQGIPASASATGAAPVPTSSLSWNNEMSALQAFFPKGSINPGNAPQGGADFYANPLPELTKAQNVTFAYSVFTPVDFEPVRGGKLPGLYGGKTGCSGGDAALDCFSTRLMWRAKHDGELYLYAPKDKQTSEVCNTPPRSICEADYGLSIGRGSFKFTPGQWTHVSQTVVLNSPGKQDGYFTLDVNGERKIELKGVYYRQGGTDDEEDDDEDDGGDDGDEENAESLDATSANGGNASGQDTNQNTTPDQGGPLGHILIAPGAHNTHPKPNVWHAPGRQPVFLAPDPSFRPLAQRRDIAINFDPPPPSPSPVRPAAYTLTKVLQPATITVLSHVTETIVVEATATNRPEDLNVVNFAAGGKVPGFSGIFFSTFFGGHDEKFATPKDQKMWFKDFLLVVNE
ncbi:hypothetical protein BDV93DRAFT_557196 [Ceratobasidium sp. AG-I]|nr:hypothetical protein BDV93DRAFT_557196 [Ceratobasidium sp. AG-I]